MIVLQLIDSLEAGGAERMAVTLANAFSKKIEQSILCTTRQEGVLKEELAPDVSYYYLAKKSTLDIKALLRLRKIVSTNKVDIIQAHGTSFFFATLLRLSYPKIRIVWHAHLGSRAKTLRKENKVLVKCSRYFDLIITVNSELKQWCEDNLNTKKVHYLENFVAANSFKLGNIRRENTIVSVANLKEPKNHLNLLRAFHLVHEQHPEWKLQLVGKRFGDAYEQAITSYISENDLEDSVALLGVRKDIPSLLQSAKLGVLSSDSEGLPMALLEYGAAGLAVIATRVGYCEEVIHNYGKTVAPNDPNSLAKALLLYIEDADSIVKDANAYHEHVLENYSPEKVIPKLIELYNN